jgi:hypothetical protein
VQSLTRGHTAGWPRGVSGTKTPLFSFIFHIFKKAAPVSLIVIFFRNFKFIIMADAIQTYAIIAGIFAYQGQKDTRT